MSQDRRRHLGVVVRDDYGDEYAQPRGHAPMARRRPEPIDYGDDDYGYEDPIRARVTAHRYVKRTELVETNDAAVQLQHAIKSKTGMEIPAAVIAGVGGAMVIGAAGEAMTMLMKFVIMAGAMGGAYIFFKKKQAEKGGRR